MSESLKSVGAITLFVDDVRRSQAFYEKTFDLTALFEDEDAAAFKFENTIVNLLKSTAAVELIEPAAIASPEAGSRAQFTIEVDDVDAMCAELARRGHSVKTVGDLDGPCSVEIIRRDAATGMLLAGSDPRRDGWALAW